MGNRRRWLSVKQSILVIFAVGVVAFLINAVLVLIFVRSIIGTLLFAGGTAAGFMLLAWLGIVLFFRQEVEDK